VGTQYIIELYYSDGIAQNKTADVYPFIYRNEDGGRWEVHIPFEAPTSKMITGYFGTLDDCSDINRAVFYVRAGNYPFAFYLSGVNIDPFKNTILLRANESKHIDVLYPEFMEWATSGGTKNKSWYLHPISE
jgi:LruC domain-containing protein